MHCERIALPTELQARASAKRYISGPCAQQGAQCTLPRVAGIEQPIDIVQAARLAGATVQEQAGTARIDLRGAELSGALQVRSQGVTLLGGALVGARIEVTAGSRLMLERCPVRDCAISAPARGNCELEISGAEQVSKLAVDGFRKVGLRQVSVINELSANHIGRLEVADFAEWRGAALSCGAQGVTQAVISGRGEQSVLSGARLNGTFEEARLEVAALTLRDAVLDGTYGAVTLKNLRAISCDLSARARTWSESDTVHSSGDDRPGLWRPDVGELLTIANVRLGDVQADVAPIYDRCNDRSTLDLQHAEIRDAWETLRDNYTGTLLVFHLALLLTFFGPLLANMSVLLALGGATERLGPVAMQQMHMHQVPIWKILLFGMGTHGDVMQSVHAVLTTVLLAYNLARGSLTYKVAKLRAREDHLNAIGIARARPARRKYAGLYRWHRALRWLFLFALAGAALKIYEAISISVWLPNL